MSEPQTAPPNDGASKMRLETLTDGVFAIVMTLLVLDIRLPDEGITDNAHLWEGLGRLGPTFVSYGISFAVLSMFWMMHHMFMHLAVKMADRMLLLINIFYMCVLSLIPFSARVLAAHIDLSGAVALYGFNVLAIGLCSLWMSWHAERNEHVGVRTLSGDLQRRARVRNFIVPLFSVLGMVSAFVWIPLALFLYAFPVFLNLVPGVLGVIERVLGMGAKTKRMSEKSATPG